MPNLTPILVTGTFTPSGTQDVNVVASVLPTGAATEATLLILSDNIARSYGTWSYSSGINGTVVVTGGKRVIGISAYSVLGGSFTINGGDTILIPAGVAYNIEPNGNLTDPTFIFSDTNTYFIELVV